MWSTQVERGGEGGSGIVSGGGIREPGPCCSGGGGGDGGGEADVDLVRVRTRISIQPSVLFVGPITIYFRASACCPFHSLF